MKNLLFISSHVPSPDIPQAGHKLAYDMLVRYSKEYNVFLVAFINEIEEKTVRIDRLSMCSQTSIIKKGRVQKFFSAVCHFWLPLRAATRISWKAKKIVRNIVKSHDFDRVHFEYSEIAYLEKYCRNILKRVLVIQDVLFQGLQRKAEVSTGLKKFLYNYEAERQKKWESVTYDKFDNIQVLAEKDKVLLENIGISSNKINVVSPTIDKKYYSVDRSRIEKYSILYFAAFNRPENSNGALWFINYVLPLVKNEISSVVLYLVGAYPPPDLQKKNGKGVVITGFVSDPIPFFEKCHAAIAPLRLGAGVKIKVLEYLAAGIPVVATSVGSEGINNVLISVADTPEEFARLIIKLLLK